MPIFHNFEFIMFVEALHESLGVMYTKILFYKLFYSTNSFRARSTKPSIQTKKRNLHARTCKCRKCGLAILKYRPSRFSWYVTCLWNIFLLQIGVMAIFSTRWDGLLSAVCVCSPSRVGMTS